MSLIKPRQKEFYSNKHDKPHRLNYVEWGDHKNPEILICVHGLARNSRDFDIVAQSLSDSYRVIALDIVGRGKSEWIDASLYNYDTYAKDIESLFEQLKIKKANWLGTSMGGIIGMNFSSQNSGMINKLCLNDIGPYIEKECLARIARYVGQNPKFKDLDQAEAHIRVMLAQFGIRSPENWRTMTMQSTFMDDTGDLRLSYDPNISQSFKARFDNIDLTAIWEKVNFEKCLVLRGSKSDVLLPQTLDFMLSSKENITSATFEGIGHAPALMEDDQVKVVANWFLE